MCVFVYVMNKKHFCVVLSWLLQNIARKTKRSRPPNLKDLLLLAVNRMMFQGVSVYIHSGTIFLLFVQV